MKKIFLGIIVFLLFFIATNYSNAQSNLDYQSAYQDYVNTLDSYKKSHSDYTLARSQYVRAGTLVSRTKAQEATINMLQDRDNVIITYLTAITYKVQEEQTVNEIVKDGLLERLNIEIFWFSDHRDSLSSAGTLEDLERESEEAKERFEELTQNLVYESLSVIATGRVNNLRNELNQIVSDTREKTAEIRKDPGDVDVNAVDRWLVETERKVTRSLDKSIQAESATQTFQGEKKIRAYNNYQTVVGLLEESLQLLREGSTYMREVLKSIKTI